MYLNESDRNKINKNVDVIYPGVLLPSAEQVGRLPGLPQVPRKFLVVADCDDVVLIWFPFSGVVISFVVTPTVVLASGTTLKYNDMVLDQADNLLACGTEALTIRSPNLKISYIDLQHNSGEVAKQTNIIIQTKNMA